MTPTDPPGAQDNQSLVEKRLAEILRSNGIPETHRIEWRDGQPRTLTVIDMPVEVLYYNPETHRLRAQRAYNPALDAALAEDPWTPESQEYLHRLLKAKPDDPDRDDPDFTALMDDLANHPQNAPALITPTGILVDGNTRRAALKELKRANIRVAVLPGDWGWEDVGTVELSLQLRKELRRDYSYINEIITMSEETRKGRTPAELAKAFRTTAAAIRQCLWVLDFIDDAIKRSAVTLAGGSSAYLRRMDFEGHKESLKEIHTRYLKTKAADSDLAERLKESSLVALLADEPKTAIRAIWLVDDFDEKYFKPKLPEDLRPKPAAAPAAVSIPGLSVSVAPDDPKVEEARATTDKLLKAKAQAASATKLTTTETADAGAIIADAKKAINTSLRNADRDVKQAKRKLAASEKLDEATDALQACIEDIARARSQNALDGEALDESLISLRDTLRSLARVASRGVSDPAGKGLSWLLRAAMDQG